LLKGGTLSVQNGGMIEMEFILGLGTISYSDKTMDLDSKNSTSANLKLQADATDTEVWNVLKQGQSQALHLFYERYSSLVYRLAFRVLGNSQEAEDLTQDIFLTLWRSRNYDPNRGSLGSYLTTLTRSRAIDKLRSRGTQTKFLQRWSQLMVTESSSPSPFEAASLSQRSEQLKAAIAQLPASQRQVLEMAYFEGMSQSEIAKQLETPLGTVKSWCRQGLLNLRKNLQNFID
jgi:RNA polymerase sigma-70 factor (ECF subfamily)